MFSPLFLRLLSLIQHFPLSFSSFSLATRTYYLVVLFSFAAWLYTALGHVFSGHAIL